MFKKLLETKLLFAFKVDASYNVIIFASIYKAYYIDNGVSHIHAIFI